LKEILSRQRLAALNDPREPPVAEVHLVHLAALALELEAQRRAGDLDVLVLQRGQTIGAVGLGVLVVAHPDAGALEQADHRGQHLLARQTGE